MASTLCFKLCSAHHAVLQIKKSMRSVSAINPVATDNMGNKHNRSQQKGASQDEVTSNSEEVKHIALSIVELCLTGDIN